MQRPRTMIWCLRIAGFLFLAMPGAEATAQPSRYALVIGVGSYASPKVLPLDGPRFDAAAVRDEITARWGFPIHNVRTLVDADATRKGILDGLDWLIAQSRSGDEVLVYFSGHGTSRQDRNQLRAGLHPSTGALLPYDLVTTSEQTMIDTLIIGRRDLRPRLERLDADRRVLVVVDSCYSRNVTRSFVRPRGASKAAPLFGEIQEFSVTAETEPYPYRNVISLTAASESEEARDIDYNALRDGVQTIDGRPKGSLTDALLRGLRGDANTDDNRTLAIDELFEFIRRDVSTRFSHTPQLVLPSGGTHLAGGAVFGNDGAAPSRRAAPVVATLRVRMPPALARTVWRVSRMEGISVSPDGQYDVSLTDAGGRWFLHDQSGDLLQDLPANSIDELAARLGRERYARQLVSLRTPGQEFNVRIDMPSRTGVLHSGRTYTITADVDVPAALLMVNVDREGTVSVLIPQDAADARPRSRWLVPEVRVAPPEGTEFIKVIAFRSPPEWLQSWAGAGSLAADSPRVVELIRQLRSVEGGVAEGSLKVVTVR